MSKDKYPSIFSPQMEAIVFIILQIFFATRAVLKIIGQFEERNAELEWAAVSGKDRCVTTLITAARETTPVLAVEYSPTWRVY